MSICYIYKITNLLTGKCYIGFTNRNPNKRKAEHFSPCQYLNRKTKLYSAIKCYGVEKFSFEIVYCSKEENHCLQMEAYFIGYYKSIEQGYNLTFGGDKPLMSKETKNKISNTKLGHSVSTETREKLRKHFCRPWKIIYSDGREIVVTNMKKFCKQHKTEYKNLIQYKRCKKLNINKVEKL